MIKKTPGPLAPPFKSRPRRKMTARLYSCMKRQVSIKHIFRLKYLNNFHSVEKGEWKSNNNDDYGADGEEEGANTRTLLTY